MEKRLDVAYAFHDPVRLKTGERSRETGRIVALVKVDLLPIYVIEFPDGSSVNAVESAIQHIPTARSIKNLKLPHIFVL